ncbi:MAG TPA: NUDIX hydrolase, partial [Euzebya sp.]|nr:NUDIX hydrolase [Euzebya sp.]
PDVAAAVRQADPSATVRTTLVDSSVGEGEQGAAVVDVVLLLSGELARAGERAPAVLDAAVSACRPGGWIAVAVPSAVWAALRPAEQDGTPGLTADALTHMLAERGLGIRLRAAPGAAAGLAGRAWAGAQDLALDSTAGLLDSAPLVLAVGQTPRTMAERSDAFFGSIARKIVAAAVLCLDDAERLLLVFDIFKDGWTLPGGLVDADESPIDAAVREAREEGGVDVAAGDLLGLFAHSMPDRIHLVYAATPVDDVSRPEPLHDHEIAEVRWVEMDQALRMVDTGMRRRIRACLDHPGNTWQW